jgi:hypothetical protein
MVNKRPNAAVGQKHKYANQLNGFFCLDHIHTPCHGLDNYEEPCSHICGRGSKVCDEHLKATCD